LTLVINRDLEIVGFCAGNDVSSRSIEGENPLYLPQAKIYDNSCALGPGIVLLEDGLNHLAITLAIIRAGELIFSGESRSDSMKRRPEELAVYLGKEITFPEGVLLMTGTGIVPPNELTLEPGDTVRVSVGDLLLENTVSLRGEQKNSCNVID
jgi:2-dehydro-3-deoxy-D-arabinonate dehydratase